MRKVSHSNGTDDDDGMALACQLPHIHTFTTIVIQAEIQAKNMQWICGEEH